MLNVVETGVDESTGSPFKLIELKCGHWNKYFTVAKQVDISGLFKRPQDLSIHAEMVQGRASVLVSGKSQITGGPITVNIGQNCRVGGVEY